MGSRTTFATTADRVRATTRSQPTASNIATSTTGVSALRNNNWSPPPSSALHSKRPSASAFIVNLRNSTNQPQQNNPAPTSIEEEFNDNNSVRSLPSSHSSQSSPDKIIRPSDFIPEAPRNEQDSSRTAHMSRQSQRTGGYLEGVSDCPVYEEDEDVDDVQSDEAPSEEDLERGFVMLLRPDASYLGFVPSANDRRPYLAALPLVGSHRHPEMTLCPFYLPISVTHRFFLIFFVLFVFAGTAIISFFTFSNGINGVHSQEK